jgi:hypothetical protein
MLLGVAAFVSEGTRRRLATSGGLTVALLITLGPTVAYVGFRLAALIG